MCVGRQAQKRLQRPILSAHWSRPEEAACAVATSLLITIYHMIKHATQFADL
jgi:hypothetical protein